jgi:hypothetical protein
MKVKKEGIETKISKWSIAVVALFIPGAGHCLQGRWKRGLLLGACIIICFFLGLKLGGHLFAIGGSDQGGSSLLRLPPLLADLGVGVPFFICWIKGYGFAEEARLVTFEYGTTCLLIAGLLNYLTVLDAFDIRSHRKL